MGLVISHDWILLRNIITLGVFFTYVAVEIVIAFKSMIIKTKLKLKL
jgi:hypothetical protein